MKASISQFRPLLIGIALLSLVFYIELHLQTPTGTVAYLLAVLLVLWFSRTSRYVGILGVVATIFSLTAYFWLLPDYRLQSSVQINRVLALVIVWLAVYITSRYWKLYEERYSKTEQLNALFQHAHEGILFMDTDGLIRLTNPFLETMFGFQSGELLSKNIQALMPEPYALSYSQFLQAYVRQPENKSAGLEVWAKQKNGTEFPAEISLSHFYNKNQLMIIAFINDITEKKKQQQTIESSFSNIKNYNLELEEKVKLRTQELERTNLELKKSQYLYKAMAQNFPDGIIGVLDKDMKYLLVDGKDLTMLGLNKKSMIGDRLFDNVYLAITTHAEDFLKKVYEGESLSFDVELQGKFYNVSSVPIVSDGKEINEILVVIKNITAQKKLEKQLMRTLAKEKELNVLKSRFVTMASHEFRTPLTTILTSAFLLDQYSVEKLEKEKSKHIDRIKRSVNGMTDVLNDFLSIGKLEEGKVQVTYSEIDIRQFIEELLQELSTLPKADQKINFELDGEVPWISTDKQLLRHIFINLLSNAIKYSPPSAVIQLHIRLSSENIAIEIADQGIGIPLEEQKHIFKRFFRAQNASNIEGTGLGLNIVKRYVKLLGGNIDFTSTLGKGSIFTVHLPRKIHQVNPSKLLPI
jgi:PAS domain S-box-containing protein